MEGTSGPEEAKTLEAFAKGLRLSEHYFRMIENAVPSAQWVPWDNRFNWRFVERLPTQALLQKLARQITGVKTIGLLLQAGLLQEIGVLYRMLDEIEQDITFLSIGISKGELSENHHKYLEYFWSEAEDDKDCPVRRKTIRAYINRAYDQPDPSTADGVSRTIYKTYSDFVHARSAPIMGMLCGPPPRFVLGRGLIMPQPQSDAGKFGHGEEC